MNVVDEVRCPQKLRSKVRLSRRIERQALVDDHKGVEFRGVEALLDRPAGPLVEVGYKCEVVKLGGSWSW